MTIKKEITREARVKKEFLRLKRIFKDIPKDVMDTHISLLENAAFMTVTLQDLQRTITDKGVISEYQNGENQWGTKKSPEVEIYNTMVKNHASIIKQIAENLPEQSSKDVAEDIMKFAFSGKK